MRIARKVGFGQIRKPVHWVLAVTSALTEGPTPVVPHRIDHGHPDHVLQPAKRADDGGSRSPRTRQRNIKMISAPHRGERSRIVAGNPFTKGVFLPLEGAVHLL